MMRSDQDFLFSISIVSHGHRDFIISLFNDLSRIGRHDIEVILTWNISEEKQELEATAYPFPIIAIANASPKGFASNHNSALKKARGKNFVILNPDISIENDPFIAMKEIIATRGPCICAPRIVNVQHETEDSARFFPSPLTLGVKAITKLFGHRLKLDKVPEDSEMLNPEWVAGMFMVIPRDVYIRLNGLDERYYLYYEDVNFCARARCAGLEIYVSKRAAVIHHARRESHRSLRYLTWHLRSALRFFTSREYMVLNWRRISRRMLPPHSQ